MEENLMDLASRLQGVIDTAIDGIITIDKMGMVETINESACRLFDYRVDEVVGNNINMLMPEPYRSSHDKYIQSYHTTQKPKIIGIGREVIGQRKDGTKFPFRLAVSKVVLNDRIIFTGIIHDLTEVKLAQQKLNVINKDLENKVQERTNELELVINKLLTTNKKLELSEIGLKKSLQKEKELNELKTRFLSMASHEFRTPLSTIISSASIISKYEGVGQQNQRLKHVDRIKSAVVHLNEVLTDFLSLGKFEENKIRTHFEEINLTQLCKAVVDEIEGLLKPGQQIDFISDKDINVVSDVSMIRNILFNILSNAIKFSPENSPIKFELTGNIESFILTISDRGIGIPIDEQKHLADRFFRATNATTVQGTGLGLHIVEQYLHLLKGSISYSSHENKGTTVSINIPNHRAYV